MSPADYVRRYHGLTVQDVRQGINEIVDIQNYCSGWDIGPKNRQQAYADIIGKICAKLGVSGEGGIGDWFSINDPAAFESTEQFSRAGLYRAYLGKASPDEIGDAIRLANYFGLVKGYRPGGGTVSAYAKALFGIDCNAFVGNYFGISPNLKPRIFALGYAVPQDPKDQGKFGIGRNTQDIKYSSTYLPLVGRTEPAQIQSGDVIITVVNDAVNSHEHIGLIEACNTFSYVASAAESKQGVICAAMIQIAEWGTDGNVSKHISSENQVKLAYGPLYVKNGKNKWGGTHALGFQSMSNTIHDDKNNMLSAFRYIFKGPCEPDSAGWGRCGHPEA